MRTQEQVTLTEDVPARLWRDAVLRDAFWQGMRAKLAAGVTEQRPGWSLVTGREERQTLYMRNVTGLDGASKTVECMLQQADFARLKLTCWAAEQ